MEISRIRTILSDVRLTPKIRLRIAVASVILYLLLFYALSFVTDYTGLPILAVIPVIIIAWLYGIRSGIITGLACFPANLVMLAVIGIDPIDNLIKTGGGLVGTTSLVLVGFIC